MMSPKQQRRLQELESRLASHGELIEQQSKELLAMEWQLFNARSAALIGWAGLLFMAYRSIFAPLLERWL